MKKFYFVKSLMAFLLLFTVYIGNSQTIIHGGKPGNFGIDADLKSDTLAFGTSMGSAVGTDDWFKKAGGTGLAIIDTTGAAYAKQRLLTNNDYIFDMGGAHPRFTMQNGSLYLDSRYARDGAISDLTYFTGSATNGQDPTTWPGSTSAGSPLDKCDIVDSYIHLRRDGPNLTGPNQNHLFMMMGASIVSTSGSHYLDFELYKDKITYNQSTGKFTNSGPTFSGGHTQWLFDADGTVNEMGDMQISFTFNSSSVSDITAWIWVSRYTYFSGPRPKYFDFVQGSWSNGSNPNYGYAQITSKSGIPLPIWGLINTTAVPAPSWGTTSKELGSNSNNYYSPNYAPGQFVEVGIDFTALGTDPAYNPYYNPCQPPYRRFIVKSRSSNAFNASLKDFTGPFPFVEDFTPPPAITPPANLACNVSTVQLKPDTLVTPGVYEWTTPDGNISTNPEAFSITVNQKGNYVLKTRTYKGCSSLSDSVIVTMDDHKPVAKAGGPYYLTALNPITLLKGGDALASNYSTPFGNSHGLKWNWSGPSGFLKLNQFADTDETGTYTLTVTELRNGCEATSMANVAFLSTLPIKLNNFGGVAINKNTIDLKWNTTTEDGTEKYILERSVNGVNFTPIYNIAAPKASPLSNYGFRDDVTGLSVNTIYYRVKIYSHSVLYSVSNIVKISAKPDEARNNILSVIQNGVRTNMIVNFYSTIKGYVSLNVMDADGKVLYKTQLQANTGLNSVEIPVNKINTMGVKFIQMTIQQSKLNYKFLFK